MSRVSWMQAKNNMPVNCIEKDFFRNARRLESKVNSARPRNNFDDSKHKLIEAKGRLGNEVIQHLYSDLNRVYKDASQYKQTAQVFYSLLDMHLRFFRFAQIDDVLNELQKGKGDKPEIAEVLKTNFLNLLENIKMAIHAANENFESVQDVDDEIVYLVDLTREIEVKLRYYAKATNTTEQGEELIDYYDKIEREKGKQQALQSIEDSDEPSDFVQNTEDELEDMFEV